MEVYLLPIDIDFEGLFYIERMRSLNWISLIGNAIRHA